jgi:two-component system, chemotaxis family, response regulator PixH
MSSTVTSAGHKPHSPAVAGEAKSHKTEHGAASAKSGGIERRRRRRAKITAQVLIRATESAASKGFREVCTTVDVSRDGLQLLARETGYWKGQQLHVTFPYSTEPGAIHNEQEAEVVRVQEQPGKQFAVALHFHEARIDAKAERKGATPYARDTRLPGRYAPEPVTQPSRPQSLVLAVEPDTRSAEAMRGLLQQDGYTVVIVSTAKEALHILRSAVPAVFVAEVESQDITGHELCQTIKRDPRLQRVPVILLTRSAKPADYSASHQLGAVVCMAKPFKPERLQHVVRLVAPPPIVQNAYGGRLAGAEKIERTL